MGNLSSWLASYIQSLLILACCLGCSAQPQTNPMPEKTFGKDGDRKGELPAIPNWFTKSLTLDGVPGSEADRAYTLPFAKPSVAPLIVAVIDSGVDIDHQDLKENVWNNLAELNGKPNIDDDKNGYIDDFHGWNFLGGYDKNHQPTHITQERLEITRESDRMKKLKKFRERIGRDLTEQEQQYYDLVTTEVEDNRRSTAEEIATWIALREKLMTLASKISSLKTLKAVELTYDVIKSAVTENSHEADTKKELIYLIESNQLTPYGTLSGIPRLNARIANIQIFLLYYYNEDFNPRSQIIGDNPANFRQRRYGNNVVQGPLNEDGIAEDASHGTHVAGIIAAKRNNGLGIDGIARDALIMPIRAIPDGDEYDKDIVNSVRYAVDNGAKIINMSFGKDFSPHKAQLDKAFEYAAQHDVLILHAAGNEATNNDETPSFPNPFSITNPLNIIDGWMDVGASTSSLDEFLVAEFSNYGKNTVHLFAPGYDIVSTVPANQYDSYSGTSMAAPVVSGVAALVWSQFPSLSAKELHSILLKSVQKPQVDVYVPGTEEKTSFETLSQTGGIVNAYRAMRLACEYTGKKGCWEP